MKSYGYEVQGNAAALEDITEVVKSVNMWINWGNSKQGIFTGRGMGIDIKSK